MNFRCGRFSNEPSTFLGARICFGRLDGSDDDGWDKVIAINLSGVFYGMRYQIPAMKAAGGGAIVNIASILGQVGFRNSAAYVAAKHGVVGLTKSAALEHAPDNGVGRWDHSAER